MGTNMKPEIEEWYNQLTEEQKSRLDIFVIFGGKDNRRITQREALFEGQDIPEFIKDSLTERQPSNFIPIFQRGKVKSNEIIRR